MDETTDYEEMRVASGLTEATGPEPARPRRVESALDEQEAVAAQLHGAITRLYERLAPIRYDAPPADSEKKASETPSGSPYRNRIEAHNGTIRNASTRLIALMDDLDV